MQSLDVPQEPRGRAQSWLRDAVLYQVYPQSYADSNGDGIGDVAGIASRLDYLQWLGVDAIWISPCWTSPFRDAGYDVTDYLEVAPRYGSNDELVALIDAARSKGIRVLLDLVPGHTSVEHPWFLVSMEDATDHRYIWRDDLAGPTDVWVPSPGSRPGYYRHNFYPWQPALNYGYARPHPDEPWRQPVDAEGPRQNRAAMREILTYWIDRGAAGFRVDMAASLVKDDPGRRETTKLWREVRAWLDACHPETVLLSEWGDPAAAIDAGFHADFFLHIGASNAVLHSLWNNHAGMDDPTWGDDPCFFEEEGPDRPDAFLAAWEQARAAVGDAGLMALPTANHDFPRLACGSREGSQLAAAFTFLLTWPTIPVVYYGDEIGMKYMQDMPNTEGSRRRSDRNRGGSRTPMQWGPGPTAGFSTAPLAELYLPVDSSTERPTVEAQRYRDDSLLALVRRLIALRRKHDALSAGGRVTIVAAAPPFAYIRGDSVLVVVNPHGSVHRTALPAMARNVEPLEVSGVHVTDGDVVAQPHGYGVFALQGSKLPTQAQAS